MVEEIRLMRSRELRRLFPDAILKEGRIGPFVKSSVAVKSSHAGPAPRARFRSLLEPGARLQVAPPRPRWMAMSNVSRVWPWRPYPSTVAFTGRAAWAPTGTRASAFGTSSA